MKEQTKHHKAVEKDENCGKREKGSEKDYVKCKKYTFLSFFLEGFSILSYQKTKLNSTSDLISVLEVPVYTDLRVCIIT